MDTQTLIELGVRFPDATLTEIVALLSGPVDQGPWIIGKNYHIRTVTHYWTGRLVAVTQQEIVLENAAWIADTGRFSDFFSEGPSEVEPVHGPVIIGRGAIVDAQSWTISLPRAQK
jgi:hypothetical protein